MLGQIIHTQKEKRKPHFWPCSVQGHTFCAKWTLQEVWTLVEIGSACIYACILEEGARSHYRWLWAGNWTQELWSSGPLEEQSVLSTSEPSLQPCYLVFFSYCSDEIPWQGKGVYSISQIKDTVCHVGESRQQEPGAAAHTTSTM